MTNIDEEVRLSIQYSRNYVSASPFANPTAKEHISGLCDLVEKLHSKNTKDAERYRWLRDKASNQPVASRPPMVVIETMSGDDVEYLRCEDLDAAVDAVRTPKDQTK